MSALTFIGKNNKNFLEKIKIATLINFFALLPLN